MTIFNKLVASASRLRPATVHGEIDFLLGKKRHYYPWGGPFNGQTVRRELCRRCLVKLKPEIIIETGTYRGTTTEFLAEFDSDVCSVESSERFFAFSKKRFSKNNNVYLILGSSSNLFDEIESKYKNIRSAFAYFDAHWEDYLPLRDEISAISRLTQRSIVLIDDFKVPHDKGYLYDDYGDVGSCTLEYISPAIPKDMKVYFPTTPSAEETGVRSGYCFLAMGDDEIALLDSFSELTRS